MTTAAHVVVDHDHECITGDNGTRTVNRHHVYGRFCRGVGRARPRQRAGGGDCALAAAAARDSAHVAQHDGTTAGAPPRDDVIRRTGRSRRFPAPETPPAPMARAGRRADSDRRGVGARNAAHPPDGHPRGGVGRAGRGDGGHTDDRGPDSRARGLAGPRGRAHATGPAGQHADHQAKTVWSERIVARAGPAGPADGTTKDTGRAGIGARLDGAGNATGDRAADSYAVGAAAGIDYADSYAFRSVSSRAAGNAAGDAARNNTYSVSRHGLRAAGFAAQPITAILLLTIRAVTRTNDPTEMAVK